MATDVDLVDVGLAEGDFEVVGLGAEHENEFDKARPTSLKYARLQGADALPGPKRRRTAALSSKTAGTPLAPSPRTKPLSEANYYCCPKAGELRTTSNTTKGIGAWGYWGVY